MGVFWEFDGDLLVNFLLKSSIVVTEGIILELEAAANAVTVPGMAPRSRLRSILSCLLL